MDNDQLDAVREQFRTGSVSFGWDPTTAQVVIEAYPFADFEADDDVESLDDANLATAEMLLIRIPVGSSRALAKRARKS